MERKMEYGDWAQVVGTYDLKARRGTLLSMLPTKVAFASKDGGEDRAHLKGFDENEKVLFDLAVNPMTASCGVQGKDRMFEEYVPVTPALAQVKLFIDGARHRNMPPAVPCPKVKSSSQRRLLDASIIFPCLVMLQRNQMLRMFYKSDLKVMLDGTRWRQASSGRTLRMSTSISSQVQKRWMFGC
ncbi:hypothetical protein AJ88_15805 [Mesorhizobium amorphae CCBAU 01583]|nr:hypothetical protein AJ88_15805 [Mesorhizobium amorphae CCBAU 01583]